MRVIERSSEVVHEERAAVMFWGMAHCALMYGEALMKARSLSMIEKKYIVPEGMLQAALSAADELSPFRPALPDVDGRKRFVAEAMVREVLRWQSENPGDDPNVD